MDFGQLTQFATLAVNFDKENNFKAAAYYYHEAANLIDKTLATMPQKDANYAKKSCEYRSRAEILWKKADSDAEAHMREVSVNHRNEQSDLDRGHFLLREALDEDEAGNSGAAIGLYAEAVELCIKAQKETSDKDLVAKLDKIAKFALDRAELLKGIPKKEEKSLQTKAPLPTRVVPPLGIEGLNLTETPGPTKVPEIRPTGHGLTEEEKKVLMSTSIINGRQYLPFMDSIDLKERFAFPVPFTDKDGKLILAPKQKSKLVSWSRPEDFMSHPTVISGNVDCFSVKQTVVSDCSVVASITVAAQYEKRFGQQLITANIFPQNKSGVPLYNPCGKYMVKLRINGVARKVIVDDFFPIGPHGEPLCSYSNNRNELWVSILEKAYMKVMGGYDFPGSNSNIDLHALTGWIPERVSIKVNDPSFNKDQIFKKIFERFHKGHVLVTLATGEMSEAEADRAGLVPCHAYALLDIREVNGVKLLMIKNPWSHLRWKGNYSELDTRHWTPEMMAAVKYDPKNAQNFDNGVFWMDYDSLCQFYDVIYMNWNPSLFKHTYVVHQTWHAGAGPAKDLYSLSQNPQYTLEIEPGSGVLWILLTRHITEIDDFKNNKEYITVLVYKNDGKKVFYPFDPPPYIDGVRINSPHYLAQTVIKEDSPRRFTLVMSQFEKSSTLHFSLRVYSSLAFTLKKIGDPYKYKQKFVGEWSLKNQTAGGCGNYRDTYPNNPRYQLQVNRDCQILFELRGPKQYQVGFDILCTMANDKSSPKYFKSKQSGPYRSGYVVLPIELTGGTYDIIPTTFRPGQEGSFFLDISSAAEVKIGRIK